jgi:ABC-type branched-subunit amino acid transport system ATPase component
MINSLQVQNFRCFQNLELKDLGNVNIVVGKNGAGKTALLESILLPGSSPNVPFILRQFRGMAMRPVMQQRLAYENLWKDLFFRYSQNVPIQITLRGTQENSRDLRIYYDPQTEQPLFVGFQPGRPNEPVNLKSDSSIIVPIVFQTFAHGQTYTLPVKMDANGQLSLVGTQPTAKTSYFPANFVANPAEIAGLFSNIRVRKEDKKLSDVLHEIFPNITDLSAEQVYPSGMSEMYCSVPGMPEKVPLALVSNGISRMLHILLFIASQPKGVVLVDEIENGLHHSKLGQLWDAVLRLRSEYDAQIFVSTHCMECLEALKPLLTDENMAQFRMIRMEELEDGSHTARIFQGKDFRSALNTGVDPR